MEITIFFGILILLQFSQNVYGACGECVVPVLKCPSGSCSGQSFPNQIPSFFSFRNSDLIYSSDKDGIQNKYYKTPVGDFCNTLESCCALCNADPVCVQYYFIDNATAPIYGLTAPACGLNYYPASFEDSNLGSSSLTASGYTNNTEAQCMGYQFGLYPTNDYTQVISVYYAESTKTELHASGATYLGKICGNYTGTSCCQMCVNDPKCKRFYLDLKKGICGLDYTHTTSTLVSYPRNQYVLAGLVEVFWLFSFLIIKK